MNRIEIARLKLNRYKSSYIMIEAIKSTQHFRAPFKPQMIKLISGIKTEGSQSIRKDFPERCENVEDQITCLLEHAMDKNILSLTWQGWMSFV